MAHIRQLGHANLKPLKSGFDRPSPDLAYIMGVRMGDGYVGSYDVRLETCDREFAEAFRAAVRRQFGRRPHLVLCKKSPLRSPFTGRTYVRRDTWKVEFVSKQAAQLLNSSNSTEWVDSLNGRGKMAWLRGLWDSEGSVTRARDFPNWVVLMSIGDRKIAAAYSRHLLLLTGIRAGTWTSRSKRMYTVGFGRLDAVVRFYLALHPTIRRKRARFREALAHYRSLQNHRRSPKIELRIA